MFLFFKKELLPYFLVQLELEKKKDKLCFRIEYSVVSVISLKTPS